MLPGAACCHDAFLAGFAALWPGAGGARPGRTGRAAWRARVVRRDRPPRWHRADDRERRLESAWRRHRRAGLPRPWPGRRGRGAPVGGRRPAAGRRPAQVRVVHPRAMAAGACARADLRDDEPVALHRDRPDRARPRGDTRVPRPAVGGAARLSPCPRPRLRPAGRSRGRGARQAAAVHGLRRDRAGTGRGGLLGGLHPGEPGGGREGAWSAGPGGRGRPVGPDLRSRRDLDACCAPAYPGRARPGRGGRAAQFRGAHGLRRAGAAPGPREVLRRVHEREPGLRRAYRPRHPPPVPRPRGLAGHHRHRDRQRGHGVRPARPRRRSRSARRPIAVD